MDRAYKRLSNSDIIISPYVANKQWTFSSKHISELETHGIFFYKGVNLGPVFSINSEVTSNDQFCHLIYNSTEKLYYYNYISGALDGNFQSINGIIGSQSLESGSYWNYPQSTTKEIRYFPTRSKGNTLDGTWIINKICHNVYNPGGNIACTSSFMYNDGYGEYISSSLTITNQSIHYSQSNDTNILPQSASIPINYLSEYAINLTSFLGLVAPNTYNISFATTDPTINGAYNNVTLSLQPNPSNISMSIYMSGLSYYNPNFYTIYSLGIPKEIYGSQLKPETIKITSANGFGEIIDDGFGNLLFYSSSFNTMSIGNVIYPHGLLTFTSQSNFASRIINNECTMSFKNNYTVLENIVKCEIRESEFNLSQNPSILTDNSGSLQNFATSSFFTPYVTTIGLYNDSNELLAVAKLAQPVPLSLNTDTIFIINYNT